MIERRMIRKAWHQCEKSEGYRLVLNDESIGEDSGWRLQNPAGQILGSIAFYYCPWCGVPTRLVELDIEKPPVLRSTKANFLEPSEGRG